MFLSGSSMLKLRRQTGNLLCLWRDAFQHFDFTQRVAATEQRRSLKSVFNKWWPELKYEPGRREKRLRLPCGMLIVEPGTDACQAAQHVIAQL